MRLALTFSNSIKLGLLLLILQLAVACGTEELPPPAFDELETLVVDRPESAAIVCRFNTYAPADTVWHRISSAPGLRRWAADSAFVELKGGGRYRMVLRGGHVVDNPIRSFVIGKKLTYDGGMKGTWVSWQIEQLGKEGARVTFVASGISPEWRKQLNQYKDPTTSFISGLVSHLKTYSAAQKGS